MAPELDMGIAVGMGMGCGMDGLSSSSSSSSFGATSNAYLYGVPSTDALRIDDLLDFSTHDGFFDAADHHHGFLPQTEPYLAATADNCAISIVTENNVPTANLAGFPNDPYIPSEEAAELEWLSKFVEDSFSDMPFPSPPTMEGDYSSISVPPVTDTNCYHHHNVVPGRARSKRSRAPATLSTHLTTGATWSSSLPTQLSTSPSSSSSSSSETKQRASNGGRKKDMPATMMGMKSVMENGNGGARTCTHCSSEKTPQWRTGPLGPKTLCNACGVRYKSGRLVPEYRPAASPTFMLTHHSNSHRKVMELRRQKELLIRHQQHQHYRESSPSTVLGAVSAGSNSGSTTRPDMFLC